MFVPHIINTKRFSEPFLEALFRTAEMYESGKVRPVADEQPLKGHILCSLFYEPSTRTRLSFEAAALRLGGRVIGTEDARSFSSAVKGESLEDSIRVISGYCDMIVLRHTEDDAAQRAISTSEVPIINAGCGKGHHPTQALLDLYTIKRKLERIDEFEIAMVGDLVHGRTIRSLAYLLSKHSDLVRMHFVAPPGLGLGDDIKQHLLESGVVYNEHETLRDIIDRVDVLYVTRPQLERMSIEERTDFDRKGSYRVDQAMAKRMKPGSIIMHPLPRTDELSPEVDNLPQAAYFYQAKCGLWIRQAILNLLVREPELFQYIPNH